MPHSSRAPVHPVVPSAERIWVRFHSLGFIDTDHPAFVPLTRIDAVPYLLDAKIDEIVAVLTSPHKSTVFAIPGQADTPDDLLFSTANWLVASGASRVPGPDVDTENTAGEAQLIFTLEDYRAAWDWVMNHRFSELIGYVFRVGPSQIWEADGTSITRDNFRVWLRGRWGNARPGIPQRLRVATEWVTDQAYAAIFKERFDDEQGFVVPITYMLGPSATDKRMSLARAQQYHAAGIGAQEARSLEFSATDNKPSKLDLATLTTLREKSKWK